MTLSERLQELRKANHLSQEQLAEKLDVSRQAISKWESAQANPDINNIVKLSKIYDVSTDYILMGKRTDNQTVCSEKIVYKEKKGFKKLNDLPVSVKTALSMLIIALGIFVVVPVLFVVSMELLGSIF